MLSVQAETEAADKRGLKFKEKLQEKYPRGLKVKVHSAHMARLKIWDSYKGEHNRSWNIVAWRDDRHYPHSMFNELLWRVFLIFPVRWCYIPWYSALDDVYSTIFHAHVEFEGSEKFVLSLTRGQKRKYEGKEILIKDFGCVKHRLQGLLIGHDAEIYPQEVKLL